MLNTNGGVRVGVETKLSGHEPLNSYGSVCFESNSQYSFSETSKQAKPRMNKIKMEGNYILSAKARTSVLIHIYLVCRSQKPRGGGGGGSLNPRPLE